MTEATTESLAALKLFALKGNSNKVFSMLTREIGISGDDAIELVPWFMESPTYAVDAWMAVNCIGVELEPPVTFDELRFAGGVYMINVWRVGIYSNHIEGFQFISTSDYLSDIRIHLGFTESEARAYWQANGYAILYPIING